jgi:pimeloyl-ACP methyl ester carboxylesterase
MGLGLAVLAGPPVIAQYQQSGSIISGDLATLVNNSTKRSAPKPPPGFVDRTARANGINIHYVTGGTGPTLVLLHGYPQNSYEWFEVMPELGKSYTIIAPDLRGAGLTSAPAGGYDKATMAKDLRELLVGLGKEKHANIVGHDIGTMVAYAYADAYGEDVDRLALTEAPIPDQVVYTYASLTPDGPGFWNFGFFSLRNGLPESSVDQNETEWVAGFIDWLTVQKGSFSKRDIAAYAKPLADDAHLRASFEWFRAFPQDNVDVAAGAATKLTMPVLAVGADHSLGTSIADQVRLYADNVQGNVVADSGHWIWEEQPEQMTALLLGFLK